MTLLSGSVRAYSSSAHYDSELWNSTILLSLLAFYPSHALPYLTCLGHCVLYLPKAPARSAAPPSHTMKQFEQLLPFSHCQFRIGGRNGSNACTIIAAVFLRKFLLAAQTGTGPYFAVLLNLLAHQSKMVHNHAYDDDLNISPLLSADAVLDLQVSVGLKEAKGLFVR